METIKIAISPVTKSPWPKGRFGEIRLQDWYGTCVIAVELAEEHPGSEIVVTSATTVKGAKPEEEYYVEALASLGCRVTRLGKGNETIGQLQILKQLAIDRAARLILVCTWSHYLRVEWLCFRQNIEAEIHVAWGLPRPTELVTDLILTILYPIIDVLGLKDWFAKKVCQRRQRGKL